MNKCTNCDKPAELKTAIKNGQLLEDMCDKCINSFTTHAMYARQNERNFQKRHFAKDIIQRFDGDKINPEFVREYPEQSRREFGEQTTRGYSEKRKLL